MPYRELTMIDVKEVLRRWSAGHGDRRIGREAGADRKTVARYTQAAERLGLDSRRRGDRRRGARGRAVRAIATDARAERGVERGRAAPRAHRALAGGRCRDEAARLDEDPHAARARLRSARELRHALALCAAGARVAQEDRDGARRRSAAGPGGAGRLRRDGTPARRRRRASFARSGCSSSRSASAATSSSGQPSGRRPKPCAKASTTRGCFSAR